MIRKILFQIGMVFTLGVGTILLINTVEVYARQILTTPLLHILGGGLLIAIGLWLAKEYGKEFGLCAKR